MCRTSTQGSALVAVAENLPATFDGEIAHGRLFLRTNLDAPTYRLYVVDPERPARERTGARSCRRDRMRCWKASRCTADRLALELPRAGLLPAPAHRPRGRHRREVALPTLGQPVRGRRRMGRATSCSTGSRPTRYRPACTGSISPPAPSELWRRVEADVDPDRFEVRQVSYRSRDGTPVSHVPGAPRRTSNATGDNPGYLTGYGGFNISMTPAFSRSLLLWLEHGGVAGDPQHSGRRGVRRGLASGRDAGPEAEQLRRLHCRG